MKLSQILLRLNFTTKFAKSLNKYPTWFKPGDRVFFNLDEFNIPIVKNKRSQGIVKELSKGSIITDNYSHNRHLPCRYSLE